LFILIILEINVDGENNNVRRKSKKNSMVVIEAKQHKEQIENLQHKVRPITLLFLSILRYMCMQLWLFLFVGFSLI